MNNGSSLRENTGCRQKNRKEGRDSHRSKIKAKMVGGKNRRVQRQLLYRRLPTFERLSYLEANEHHDLSQIHSRETE